MSLKCMAGVLIACTISATAQVKQPALIPQPAKLQVRTGRFILTPQTRIITTVTADTALLNLFIQQLKAQTGYSLKTNKQTGKAPAIKFVKKALPGLTGNEAYTLAVSPRLITITAPQPRGWFYAWQTLQQLIPLKQQSHHFRKALAIPCVSIADTPRFAWRGLMVDVSRHFFSKQIMLRYIDEMAKYKLNVLHLHLTDNQGWRLEIKSLPKLTSVGAWRVPRTGYWKGFSAPQPGEAASDGGYYTQQDIKEMITYAAARQVTIVPEIDVPGHSLALIAAYPELSCTKKPQQVLAGDPWNIKRTNVLCVGNDSVFIALDKIFGEVAQLFNSPYIHIGGDEVIRTYWDNCTQCQKRISTEHLKNAQELQTYFIKRVAAIVESKGKKPIGWYENLEGGLAPNLAVMSWKSYQGGVAASNAGHQVVMTPAPFTYLDFYQGDPLMENGPFTVCRLNTCYQFNPVPPGAQASNIMGGQGSLWTEQVPNERKLQALTWPRALALAEVLWSPAKARDWTYFTQKLEQTLPHLDADGVAYSKSMYEPIITAVKGEAAETYQIKITTEIPDLKVYYTFDDTDPDDFYPLYTGTPLKIPAGAHHIRAVSYKNGQPIGRILNLPLSEVAKRIR